jgi:hypothetical protein
LHRTDLLSDEALEYGRVLRIDWNQFAATTPERVEYDRASGNEALLVGERNTIAGIEGGYRRPQPGCTDDPVDRDRGWGGSQFEQSCLSECHPLAERVGEPILLFGSRTRYDNSRLGDLPGQLQQLT